MDGLAGVETGAEVEAGAGVAPGAGAGTGVAPGAGAGAGVAPGAAAFAAAGSLRAAAGAGPGWAAGVCFAPPGAGAWAGTACASHPDHAATRPITTSPCGGANQPRRRQAISDMVFTTFGAEWLWEDTPIGYHRPQSGVKLSRP